MMKLTILCVALSLAACAAPAFSGSTPAAPPAARPMSGSFPLVDPIGLARDKAGNLYVANAGASQILVYNSKNKQLSSKTITAGVDQPEDLAFDKAGNLYATERSSVEVTVYNPSGKLIKTIHTDKSTGFSPSGIKIDSTGDIWVASRSTNYDVGEIQVFKPSGKVLHSSTKGLAYPLGIVFVGADAWVFDLTAGSITVFDSSAKFVKIIGLGGVSPYYAAKNSSGDLYVTDAAASLIAILNGSGKVLKTTHNKALDHPTGIAFNDAGDFYIANEEGNTITEYDPHGKLIHTIK